VTSLVQRTGQGRDPRVARGLHARELDDRVILAHVRGTLSAPGGPLAGEHASTITVVLLRRDDEYEITAFHNTLISG